MGRSRSRSRERRRSRSRSRDKDRDRGDRDRGGKERTRTRSRGWDTPAEPASDALAAMQAIAALQQQQQMQRQIMAQQSSLMLAQQQQQALAAATVAAAQAPSAEFALDAPPSQVNRKQRELYIGNLTVGVVSTDMLRELFNVALAAMCPDPISQPPVMEVKSDGSGRFAFVEFRTAGLAIAALLLDKIELAGRTLNIGRPKGYVEPPGLELQSKLNAALQFAVQVSGGPTNVVLLDNLMPASLMRDEKERQELYDDVFMEANKCGTVVGLAVPVPPPHVPDTESARVYVKFTTQEGAAKFKALMEGREFDDRVVKATHAPDDAYYASQGNAWV